jgi:hypothetical protein
MAGVTPERGQEDSMPADVPGAAASMGMFPLERRLDCSAMHARVHTLP